MEDTLRGYVRYPNWQWIVVLILVLMEDTLRVTLLHQREVRKVS